MTERGMSFTPLRVAVLLTDIEGSTRLWQEHAAVMPVVLMAHHRTVAEVVAEHGGRLPPDQGEGDARLAVFAGEGAESVAVGAALSLQRRFAGLELPSGIRLRVRMAVDVGEVVEFEGNVFGTVVNRCARLRGLGHGGQVLVSHDVASACAGISLVDLGEHRLRDVPEPVRVLQAEPDGEHTDFPPLSGVLSAPVVLPAPDGAMLGRDAELGSLIALARERRFVTLTATGGSGKTTLAVEAARGLVAEFPGGVYFVDLVPVDSVDDVGLTVATVMGVVDQHEDPWTAVERAAESGRPLVVLDNCEDLPDLADLLSTRGRAALERLTLLATSRRPIGVKHEVIVPLAPLATPSADAHGRAALEASPAGMLLVARALEARPGLEVDDDTAGRLAAIARRLDGIPLAMELAAARLRMQSVASLQASLDQSLLDLDDVTGRRTERHRALSGVLAWSVDHLDDESRDLLTVLSVFAASPDLAAIAGVAGRSEAEVLAPLARLLDASLVRAVELEDGAPRFTLLVPVREHIRSTTPTDVAARLGHRHSAYFLAWARDGSQTRHDTDRDEEWVVEVGSVRGDALMALENLRRTSPREAVEMSVHLCALWVEHGEVVRGQEELSRSSRAHGNADDAYVVLAGLLAWWSSQVRNEEALLRLRAAAERNGDPRLVALAIFLCGVAAKTRGDFDMAREEFATVDVLTAPLEAAESTGARALSGMSRISLIRGLLLPNEVDMLAYTHRAEAVQKARQALDRCRGPSDPTFRTAAVTLAELLVEDDDLSAAEAVVRLTDPIFPAANSSDEFVRAWIHIRRGEWDEALASLAPHIGPTSSLFTFCRNVSLAADIHLLRGDVRRTSEVLSGLQNLPPTHWWLMPAARAARLSVAQERPGEAVTRLDQVAPLVLSGDASPGTLTYLVTRAMLAEGDERRAWLREYDDRVAATGVLPWPRDAADRTALGLLATST